MFSRNFTLTEIPAIKDSVVNERDAVFFLTYENVKSNGDPAVTLTRAEIR
jgi:hypothetical protein